MTVSDGSNCKTAACRRAHAQSGGKKSDGRGAPGRDVSGSSSDDSTNFWDAYLEVHDDVDDWFTGAWGDLFGGGDDSDAALIAALLSTQDTSSDADASELLEELASAFGAGEGSYDYSGLLDETPEQAAESAESERRSDAMLLAGGVGVAGLAYLAYRGLKR